MSPLVRRTLVVLTGVVAVVAAASVAVAVTSSDDAPPKAPAANAYPTRYTGPQGGVGQFVVTCPYSHSGPNDPIVHPGMPGMSHRHDFYGSTTTNAQSTIASMHRSSTTCNKSVDTAGYWQPTLYNHGKVVKPLEIAAYYRAAPGVDPKLVKTMPQGLALIAGDFRATKPQKGDATGWTCGVSSGLSDTPPACLPGAPLHLVLTFKDCWDGKHVDSADHQSHVTYSVKGQCPEGFETHIPQIVMSVNFGISGKDLDLELASGNIYSAHGDFWNTWDPAGLQREISMCINRGAVCDLASNREEEALFSYGY